ncbi:MAG: oligosaccharide flippase family protein [Proteobacteria bacterium]|nr:oligosaccharide flippase family protein [Pseudomonadota bacterium]
MSATKHAWGAARATRLMAALAGHANRLGAYTALAIRLAAAGLAYLLQIILARALGADGYGAFTFAWSLVMTFGFLATYGFGQIAVRFLAQYHEQNALALARGFILSGIVITLVMAGALGVLGSYLLPLAAQAYGPTTARVLGLGLFALPFLALTDFFEGIARALGWPIRALAPPYLIRQGILVLALLAAMAFGGLVRPEFAILAALAASVLALAVQIALMAPEMVLTFPGRSRTYAFGDWRRAATPTFLADLAQLARQNIDLILLGIFAPVAVLGFYFAATRIASLLGLVDFSIGAAFGHRFAREAKPERTDNAAIEALFRKARMAGLLPGLAVAAILIWLTPYIMMLFGPAFEASVPPARILILAALLRLANGPAEDLLNMAGHPEAVLRGNAAGAGAMFVACLLLIPFFHAHGAALGVFVGTLASLFVLNRNMAHHLGFAPFPTGLR